MHISHKIALKPNNQQRSYFEQAAGNARFAYNWGLAQLKDALANRRAAIESYGVMGDPADVPSAFDLKKKFNAIKKTQFPWMQLTTKFAGQKAILDLGDAVDRWFKKQNAFPRFHKKGVNDSFYIGTAKVDGKRIWVPRLGWVRMREHLRFSGVVKTAVISRTADRWFVSILVDTDGSHLPDADTDGEIGIDLGIRDMATLSNCEKYKAPKPLKRSIRRLQFLSKAHSRKQKGSANRRKSARRLARLHARITNIRKDYLHKLTTALTRRFKVFRVENLSIQNMVKQRSLSRAIADMGWGEFVRQLTYKAAMRGGTVEKVNPRNTSKACSKCGSIHNLGRGTTAWKCACCGAKHDRDVNAAINILAGGSPVTACGEAPARDSKKQEFHSTSQLRLFGVV